MKTIAMFRWMFIFSAYACASLSIGAELPQPGADAGQWGTKLNDFLRVAHNADGTLSNVVATPGSISSLNVRSFGAVGDGVHDDQPALTAAVAALTTAGGGTLYFPAGTYRCGRQAGYQDAIFLDHVSNAGLVFEPGAVILMDNLRPADGYGDQGHGIRVRGPCTNIWLVNVSVQWRTLPAARSLGDGFRFEGYPADGQTISGVRMLNCSAERCPQVGTIFMGCSDIFVENFAVSSNLADGLHFNASRRICVEGLRGIANGDDTLAFVTYFSTNGITAVEPGGPYAMPDLGEWNNAMAVASGVVSERGLADGVRIAGSRDITLSNVTVRDKVVGIILDSGLEDGVNYAWTYLASRGIVINNLRVRGCNTGFFVWDFNVPLTGDERFWRYDVRADGLSFEACQNDSLHLWNCAGVEVSGVRADGQRIRLSNVRDCSLRSATVRQAGLYVGETVQPSSITNMDWMSIGLRDITVEAGSILIQDARGVLCDGLVVKDAPASAVELNRVADSRLENIRVYNASRTGTATDAALRLNLCQRVTISDYALEQDARPIHVLEVGGGSAAGVTEDVWLANGMCRTAYAATPVFQGGLYAPVRLDLGLWLCDSSATTNHWQEYRINTR